MSNTEDNFDDNDSSDAEGTKKAYESLLSNPSYFSTAMKVKMRFNFFLASMLNFSTSYSACCSRTW